jgi:polyisoprenoid-binding protein YceI
MKKTILIFLFFGLVHYSHAQKFVSKEGHIWFYSYTPIEEIEGQNRQAVSILDAGTGELQFNLLVKSFEFKNALMQEHFNENYMESDKYPKASFNGKISNSDKIDFCKDGNYPVTVAGDLTIHGVTKPVTTTGTLDIKGASVNAKAKFTVAPKDYNIEIPSLVESKIAKVIDVNVDVSYTQNP